VSYGRDGAEAILGQPQTQLLLRLPDPETARWASGAIGERHIVREVKGENAGDRGPRSQSTTWQHQIEAAVLPSQIQALPRLEGYLRVADSPEVRRIRLTPVERPEVAEAFVPLSRGSTPPAARRRPGTMPTSGLGPVRSVPSLSVRHPDFPEFG
jgi:type IV secretory pathway TraG/TraD family ATPase VirD4